MTVTNLTGAWRVVGVGRVIDNNPVNLPKLSEVFGPFQNFRISDTSW